MYEYKAKVIKVYDGDTITANVDLGFKISFTEKFRLVGINAPEIRGEERELGLISRDALRGLILDKEIIICTYKDKKGKYGRYLGDIKIEVDGEIIFVNDWLVEQGLAVYQEY
jgi:micrococcal nuclease